MTMQAISGNNSRFADALGRGDSAGVAAFYTDDGKVLATGFPTFAGREVVQQFC